MITQFWRPVLLALLLLHTATSSLAPAGSKSRILVQYNPSSSIQQVRADVTAQGMNIIQEFPEVNALLVEPNAAAVATAAAAGATTAATQTAVLSAALSSLSSIDIAEPEPVMSIPELSLLSGGEQAAGHATHGQQGGAAPAATAAAESSACTRAGNNGVDYDINQDTEGTPYGVKMVQADEAEIRDLAQQHKDKVLYCVLDTGLDTTNQDFKGAVLSGSAARNYKTGKPYPWNKDDLDGGHGTHVSGIIAAVRNGKGVVGVSAAGANLFFYRIMPEGSFGGSEQLAAWKECIAELDRRKAATNTPDMKAVISMSYGGPQDSVVVRNLLSRLAATRPDVMFFAAAGNEANATFDGPRSYPAGYSEVIGVGAVDENGQLASFSNRGSYVSLTAPGVEYMSTIPLFMTPASEFYLRKMDQVTTTPTLPEIQGNPDFFRIPTPYAPDTKAQPEASGQLVDCGLASGTCQNAAGKVCLIERGGTPFCEKVLNCQKAGGVAALIYNDASQNLCTQLGAASLLAGNCDNPSGSYITTLMLARGQGLALKSALATGNLNVKLKLPAEQTQYGLAAFSGTSMATPNAAGVAGVIWSAHTDCSRQEIQAALEATAWMPPAANAAQGTRNDRYGHGIIQALAAHTYLQQNPCKSPPKPSPDPQPLQVAVHVRPGKGTSSSQAPDAALIVGSLMRVIVRVKDAEGNKPAGATVKFTMTPTDHLKCNMLKRTTREGGVTSIKCTTLKAGRIAVKATASMPGKSGQSSSSISYLVVKQAR